MNHSLFLLTIIIPLFLIGSSTSYDWVLAINSGKSGSDEKKFTEGQWPNIHVSPVVWKDTLFMIGKEFTWTSADGIRWQRRKHDGGWGQRYGSAQAVFAGKIWYMGGMKSWESFSNDVWSSSDGVHWIQVADRAPWTERRGHGALVFNGRLWIVGGAESSGRADVLPRRSLADVWSSADGSTWICEASQAPWSRTFSLNSFNTTTPVHVFNGKLWMVGAPGTNSVWFSENGHDWKMATERAAWKGRYARGSAVFDNKIWIFGGDGLNDVWSSEDGAEWKLVMQNAPWSPRAPGYSVAFRNKLWMFGGKTGKSHDSGDEVWYLKNSQRESSE
ncbi:MAG: hypothetical protein HY562_06270 [Ignavibacteriales bacterium]|nr:hypothetical protein [Ignavibacteriales bacterium]